MSASHDARQVLLEISMLAGGATQNLNASRGGGDAIGPGGDGKHMLLYWRAEFARAAWEDRLPEAVAEARKALEGFKKGPGKVETTPETAKERRVRILKEGEGWAVEDVARALDLPLGEVRAAFDSKDWDHSTGKPWVTADREERARRLRRSGVSIPDIAGRFAVSVRTVHYWVK